MNVKRSTQIREGSLYHSCTHRFTMRSLHQDNTLLNIYDVSGYIPTVKKVRK